MKNKKLKKRLIILGVVAALAAGGIIGGLRYAAYKEDQKTVEVVPMMYVANTYWGDQTSSQGNIVADYMQEIYPDSSKSISEIFVTEGQAVSVGTPLLQYNRESLELDVEAKTIAQQQVQVRIDEANRQLRKLEKTKAYVEPTPTPKPRITPTPKPTQKPPTPKPTARPTPTPSPSTVPPADVDVYYELTVNSRPYKGTGTPEDPYVFLCKDGYRLTPGFLKLLLGLEPTPEPSEEPSESPEPGFSPGPSPEPSVDPSESPAPDESPSPSPSPVPKLTGPFAAVFEVREKDSNYGKLLSSVTLDGTGFSGSVTLPGLVSGVAAAAEMVTDVIEAPEAPRAAATPTPTPKPTPEPDNYNHMNYTKDELNKLIKEKKQELTNLQHDMKQAQLDLDRANRALENSTVLSNIDGQVRTLTDIDTATAEGKPFLVVSGAQQYYIHSTLNETMLGSVNVGDEVSITSWMNGMSYTGQIVSISDYPAENNGYYYSGNGNPNSSSYEFTAVILDADDSIQNGSFAEVVLNVNDSSGSDAYYLDKMYIREDDSGMYVMKAGKDNRIVKSYITVGKSIWGGQALEIKSGITQDEFIAFPYGPDMKEGVRAVLQDTGEPPYPDGSEDSSSSGIDDGAGGMAPEDPGGVVPVIPEGGAEDGTEGGEADPGTVDPGTVDPGAAESQPEEGGGEDVVTASMSDLKLYGNGGGSSD